jgi:diguanylate cyclase (GGDEF)-like protein
MNLTRSLFGSLSAKLLTILMLVSLFTSFMAATVFIVYELNTVTNNERSRLNSIASILSPNLTAALIFQDEYTVNELIKPLLSQSNIVSARVIDDSGNVFGAVYSTVKNKTILFSKVMTINTPLIIDEKDYGQLEIKADYSLIEQSLLFFSSTLLIILIFILLLSFLLALFLRQSIIQPLIDLTSVADLVTKTNNYSVRSKVLSRDEVGNLANCFNLMLETIEQRDHSLESTVEQRTMALKDANSKLSEQANSDSLTGLPNRRYILEKLSYLISNNVDKKFAIIALDLDGFKEINDTMGHDYGDLLLKVVSKRIVSILPKTGMVARLGGDEFIILVDKYKNKKEVEIIAQTIQIAILERFIVHSKHVYASASIGISLFPEDGTTVETIFKHADLAMYKSKEMGRNCYHFFDSTMLELLIKKREVTEDLRNGIEKEQFELYYQPIFELTDNKVCKAEALIRWNHPTRGIVSPIDFIAVAEETGLIKELGLWIAKTASNDLAEMILLGAEDLQFTINVSPVQFRGNDDWIQRWFDHMDFLGLKRDAIIVEITENLLMESEESTRSRLTKLKKYGVSIAIDDFGVGYSSLSYLQKMDIDILKIDKSFIDDVASENNSRDLCRTMIIMARHLNMEVVAEGIETEEQKNILNDFGCKSGQGYLFSKPLTLEDFKQQYFSIS